MDNNKNARDNIILIVCGALMAVLAYPLYMILKATFCANCSQVGCGICDLEAILCAALLLILGVTTIIVNGIYFRKNKSQLNTKQRADNGGKQYPIFTTFKWFFIVLLAIGALIIVVPWMMSFLSNLLSLS